MLEIYQQFILVHLQSALLFVNKQLSPRGCLIVSGILLLVLFILKFRKTPPAETKMLAGATSEDIDAIAGDDVISTQLDLARALIEMDKKDLAMPILKEVMLRGDVLQKREAEQLCVLH
ncbi:MAG: FimV/HubP family polar landmark protein [Gammaproteobacteria bacterium]